MKWKPRLYLEDSYFIPHDLFFFGLFEDYLETGFVYTFSQKITKRFQISVSKGTHTISRLIVLFIGVYFPHKTVFACIAEVLHTFKEINLSARFIKILFLCNVTILYYFNLEYRFRNQRDIFFNPSQFWYSLFFSVLDLFVPLVHICTCTCLLIIFPEYWTPPILVRRDLNNSNITLWSSALRFPCCLSTQTCLSLFKNSTLFLSLVTTFWAH